MTANFQMFVPRGRALNPITNTSWEQTGVKPDIPSAFEHTVKVAYIQALEQIDKKGNYAGPEPIKILLEAAKSELNEATKKK